MTINPKKFARLLKVFPEDEYKELTDAEGKQFFGYLNKNGRRNGLSILYNKQNQQYSLTTYFDGEVMHEQNFISHQLKSLELREDNQNIKYLGIAHLQKPDGVGLLIFPDNQNQVVLFVNGEIQRHILMNAVGRQVKRFISKYSTAKTSEKYAEFPFGVTYKMEFRNQNGDKYIGDADETGERHGEGEFFWRNGNSRRAIYKAGKEIRWLEHKFPNGDKILYEDKVNDKEYLGVKIFKNGDKFDGIIDGIQLVQGTYIYKSGEQEEREYDRTTQEVIKKKKIEKLEINVARTFGGDEDELLSSLNSGQQDIELGMSMEPQDLCSLNGFQINSLTLNSGVFYSVPAQIVCQMKDFIMKDAIQNDDILLNGILSAKSYVFSDIFGSGKLVIQNQKFECLNIIRCFMDFEISQCDIHQIILDQTDLNKILIDNLVFIDNVEVIGCSGQACQNLQKYIQLSDQNCPQSVNELQGCKQANLEEFELEMDSNEAAQISQSGSHMSNFSTSQQVPRTKRPKKKAPAPCKPIIRNKSNTPLVGKLALIKKKANIQINTHKDEQQNEQENDDILSSILCKINIQSTDFNIKFKQTEIIGSGNIGYVSKWNQSAVKFFNNPARQGSTINFLYLDHPHILKALNIFEHKNKYAVEIQLGDNSHTVNSFVDDNLDSDPSIIWPIVTQLITAISYMHGLGVLHLCLTPENIFVEDIEDGFIEQMIRISDAGFAQSFGDENIFSSNPIVSQFLIPPEFLSSETYAITKKADSWQLGMLIFYLCSGKFPFSRQELMQHMHGEEALDFKLPDEMIEFQTLVDRLLEIDPEQRVNIQELIDNPAFPKIMKYVPVLKMQSEKDVLGLVKYISQCQYLKVSDNVMIINFNEFVVEISIVLQNEQKTTEIFAYSPIIVQEKIEHNLEKLVVINHQVYCELNLGLIFSLRIVSLIGLYSDDQCVNVTSLSLSVFKIVNCKLKIVVENTSIQQLEITDQNYNLLNFLDSVQVEKIFQVRNCDGEMNLQLKAISSQFEVSDF